MKNVLVVSGWGSPDILQQTPKHSGIWDDIQYHISYFGNDIDFRIPYDYLIVLYCIPVKICLEIPKGNTCFITQEPPYQDFLILKKLFKYFDNVITQFPIKRANVIQSIPVVPWWLGKSYDFLMNNNTISKTKKLSWITSNKIFFPGHRERLLFKDNLDKSNIKYDLYGEGYKFIESKWIGLAPYKYSIAIENGCFKHYWTEKIMDCFLSDTMPIYYGCPNITDYFPEESLIVIDIHQPKEALEKIRQTINSKKWERSRDAIEYAKQLILNKYQFFPFITSFIKERITDNQRIEYNFPFGWPKENLIEKIVRKINQRYLKSDEQ